MNYREHRYLSKDGLSLYYRAYGQGDDVVLCVHGLTRNSKDFHELATRLSDRYRVLVPDVRGRGQSDRDRHRSHYNPAVYVRDVWRLLEQAEVGRVTVIGTSMGGMMGMIMADQQPERLRGLILNDIGPEVPPAAIARIMAYAGRTPPARDWAEAAEQSRRAYEIALPDMPDEFWREFVHYGWCENADGRPQPDADPAIGDALRHPPRALRWASWLRRHNILRRIGGVALDPWDSFRSVSMPCLLIHGVISDVLTPDVIRRMCEVKPDLEVVDVPGRGHTPLIDKPVAINAIEDFLARVYSPGQPASTASSGAT